MFSRHFTKILLSATALNLITACAILDKKDTAEPSNWFVRLFEKDGQGYADEATLAYSNGKFEKALEYSTEALKGNPRNQKALLVGALAAEKLGRYNRARQYYEDLIIIDGTETSILGSSDSQPQKISEIAKRNLHTITIAQSKLTIENRDGSKNFAMSKEAGAKQNKTTINNALNKKKASKPAKPSGIDGIFSYAEQNSIARFLILKELAEKDFITKEEFLSRRSANIGALLPLTHAAPGVGIDQPVPSPDLIIERLEILKDGVETRAITPREFSAEREIIIEALMSPAPRHRMKNKAPSKNILDAANDIRKLEILQDLNLITENEKETEKRAIEKYLGINRDPAPDQSSANSEETSNSETLNAPIVVKADKVVVVEKKQDETVQTVSEEKAIEKADDKDEGKQVKDEPKKAEVTTPAALNEQAQTSPAVTSPFEK